MKKAAAITAMILTVFLCSCQAADKPETICINRIFTSQIKIQYNSTAYTADFTSDENGCNAVFLSPERISGFGIAVNSGKITYSLDTLTFTAKSTPEQILPTEAIYCALSSIPETATKAESVYKLYGRTKFGNYTMDIDSKTMTPVFIEYIEAGINVRFLSST